MHLLKILDRHLDSLSRTRILLQAVFGVLVIGYLDYLTGYKISLDLFYVGPVGVAAWYAGRWQGVSVVLLSCITWYIADYAAGNQYPHIAISIWNMFIRFGLFLITSLLLTELRSSLRVLQHMAQTDGLTGLFSRRAFEARLKHDIASSHRRRSALTLVYVDVDNFKDINDKHGHGEGDRQLQLIGQVLQKSAREIDTMARVGGDEFAMILPDTGCHGAEQFISKLTREFEEASSKYGLATTCSIGVVTFLDFEGLSSERAVTAADHLMYQVKKNGKGTVAFNVLGEGAQSVRGVSR